MNKIGNELWKLFNAPHKILQWVFIVLSARVGFSVAAGTQIDSTSVESVFKYTLLIFAMIGGWAKGADVLGALGSIVKRPDSGRPIEEYRASEGATVRKWDS